MAIDSRKAERFRGLILGTAVGDALGLPAEGLSRRRLRKLFKGRWHHRLFLHYGMVSDDTDHTVIVSQCLLAHSESVDLFTRRLAWSFRLWLITLPAGIGKATLKSIARLWLGVSPARSGTLSAGNGPAMRAAPIGALFADHPSTIDEFISVSTRITHTDPRALTGARVVAHLAAWIVLESMVERPSQQSLRSLLVSIDPIDDEWREVVNRLIASLEKGDSVERFAEAIGAAKGVTGYVFHTVPVAIYSWYRNFGNYQRSLIEVLDCGGDTDTVGAIVGALAGAVVGEKGIPECWMKGIIDWPRGVEVLRRIGDKLAATAQGEAVSGAIKYFWPGVILRSSLLMGLVLVHGFRRIAPPY